MPEARPDQIPPSMEVERELASRISSLQDLYANLQSQFGSVLHSFESMQPTIAKTKAVEEALAARTSQIMHLQVLLEAKTKEVLDREAHLRSLSATLHEKSTELGRTQQFLGARTQQLLQLQVKCEGLTNREASLSEELETRKKHVERIHAESQKQREEWSVQHQEWQAMVASLRSDMDKLVKERDDVAKELEEKERVYSNQIKELENSAQQLREEMKRLAQEKNRFHELVEKKDMVIEDMQSELETAKRDIGGKQLQLAEAAGKSDLDAGEIKKLQETVVALEKKLIEERNDAQAHERETSSKLDNLQKELEQQLLHLDAAKAQLLRVTTKLEEFTDEVSKQTERARIERWKYQLRLSASNHLSQHQAGLVEDSRQALEEALTRQKEQQEVIDRIQEEKKLATSQLEAMQKQTKEKDAQIDLQTQNLSNLDQQLTELNSKHAQLVASIPTQPQLSVEEKGFAARLQETERRLRDSVEENFDLRERLSSLEDAEMELLELKAYSKAQDLRLRELIDENADLRRRAYKY